MSQMLMAFHCRAAKGLKLVVSDRLETMFSHQPKALQLRSNYPRSLGFMVELQCLYGFRVERVVGHEHLTQISFHDIPLRHGYPTRCHASMAQSKQREPGKDSP